MDNERESLKTLIYNLDRFTFFTISKKYYGDKGFKFTPLKMDVQELNQCVVQWEYYPQRH